MNQILKADKVCFSYPNKNRMILNNCSLCVNEGEIVSILGPNGAGKSTFLNCLCGLLHPQQGEIVIDGKSLRDLGPRDIAKVIAYVQQNQKSAFSHTVFEYVLMGRANAIGLFRKPSKKDREMVRDVLNLIGISNLSDSAITEISGGERQQAAIARALVQNPKLIFFDEPTAHLDYGNQINTLRLINTLKEKGFGIVMTTHNPDHCMMLGGIVAVLDKNGVLDVGDSDSILNEERLKRVYNADICLPYVKEANRTACVPFGL